MIGSRTRAKVVKNKIAPPFKEAEFDIMYGSGISREGELIDLAVKADVIQKSGAWFSYGDVRLGQGRDNVKIFFRDNPDIASKIEAELMDNIGLLVNKMGPGARAPRGGKAPAPVAAAAPAPAPEAKPAAATNKASIDIMVED